MQSSWTASSGTSVPVYRGVVPVSSTRPTMAPVSKLLRIPHTPEHLRNYFAKYFPVELVSTLFRFNRMNQDPEGVRSVRLICRKATKPGFTPSDNNNNNGGNNNEWSVIVSVCTAGELRDNMIGQPQLESYEMRKVYRRPYVDTDESRPVAAELQFDLDADLCSAVRAVCGCGNRDDCLCSKCFSAILLMASAIDADMASFGYVIRLWKFSGNKGLHCIVLDDPASFALNSFDRALAPPQPSCLSKSARLGIIARMGTLKWDSTRWERKFGVTLPANQNFVIIDKEPTRLVHGIRGYFSPHASGLISVPFDLDSVVKNDAMLFNLTTFIEKVVPNVRDISTQKEQVKLDASVKFVNSTISY